LQCFLRVLKWLLEREALETPFLVNQRVVWNFSFKTINVASVDRSPALVFNNHLIKPRRFAHNLLSSIAILNQGLRGLLIFQEREDVSYSEINSLCVHLIIINLQPSVNGGSNFVLQDRSDLDRGELLVSENLVVIGLFGADTEVGGIVCDISHLSELLLCLLKWDVEDVLDQ